VLTKYIKSKNTIKVSIIINKKLLILKNLIIKKNCYIVIFEITQLINNKKYIQKVYKTTIYSINKIIA